MSTTNRPSPQLSVFPDGGYVVHKLTGSFAGRCSAWFDASGRMLDAEQMTNPDSLASRPVKRGGPIWREIELIGARYAPQAV